MGSHIVGVECPESRQRERMTDAEFWERMAELLGYNTPYDPMTEADWLAEAEASPSLLAQPCVECGSTGACAYDAEGRPMIHSIEEDDDDD